MQNSQGFVSASSSPTSGPNEMRFGQAASRWGVKKSDRSARTGPPSAGREIKRAAGREPVMGRSLKAISKDHPRYAEWRANKR